MLFGSPLQMSIQEICCKLEGLHPVFMQKETVYLVGKYELFERRRNVRLSTLRAYAAALGGRLRLVFDRAGGQTEIRLRNERER